MAKGKKKKGKGAAAGPAEPVAAVRDKAPGGLLGKLTTVAAVLFGLSLVVEQVLTTT